MKVRRLASVRKLQLVLSLLQYHLYYEHHAGLLVLSLLLLAYWEIYLTSTLIPQA
jgi:hypothetical protein